MVFAYASIIDNLGNLNSVSSLLKENFPPMVQVHIYNYIYDQLYKKKEPFS
jgi:hypothetical protein